MCRLLLFVLQSAREKFSEEPGELLVLFRFKNFIFFALIFAYSAVAVFSQATPTPTPVPKSTPVSSTPLLTAGNITAEGVAESVILVYGYPRGRETLNHIRKTTYERGKITLTNSTGLVEKADYERWTLRGDSLEKERIRLNQEYPNARFALIYKDDKIFGIFNEQVFEPTDEASKKFENQTWRGIEGLLRYKENGSTLKLDGKEKVMGVEFYRLDVTDKQDRKTRFFVSTKSLRVMMLEYTEGAIKYRRKFYDYNYVQGTLVFSRTVLWADGKQVEETDISIVSFGQRIDESIFQASS